MPFPDIERVIYENNPLIEVVCEVRFPTILKISAEEPLAFQERVRATYPEYETTSQTGSLPQGVPDLIRPLLQSALQERSLDGGGRKYRFSNPDNNWHVLLAQNSLAISTSQYERWEHFQARLADVLDVLLDTYQPTYFSRLGLRYRNVVSLQKLGLQGTPWQDLLAQPVLGELSSEELLDIEVLGANRSLILQIDEDMVLTLSHGFVDSPETQGESYLIDADYYKEGQIDTKTCLTDAERFHEYAGRVFQWCITNTLHDALGPVSAQE